MSKCNINCTQNKKKERKIFTQVCGTPQSTIFKY